MERHHSSLYRVTHLASKNLMLTWIWDVLPSCLGYSSGPPAPRTVKIKSAGGFHRPDRSRCRANLKELRVLSTDFVPIPVSTVSPNQTAVLPPAQRPLAGIEPSRAAAAAASLIRGCLARTCGRRSSSSCGGVTQLHSSQC